MMIADSEGDVYTVDMMNKYLHRYSVCSKTYLGFSCPEGHGNHYVQLSCNLMFCPQCAQRRYDKFFAKYGKKLLTFKNPKLMTLTVPNKDTIEKSDFDKLTKYWKELRKKLSRYHKLKENRGRNISPIIFKRGIRVFEVTHKGNGFHPHMHILYEGSFISEKLLSRLWKEVTRDAYIVDVKAVKGGNRGIQGAIKYVGAYMSKGSNFKDYEYFMDMCLAIKNVTLISTFGTDRKDLKIVKKTMVCPVCSSDLRIIIDSRHNVCFFSITDFIDSRFKKVRFRIFDKETGNKVKDVVTITDKREEIVKAIDEGMTDFFDLVDKYGHAMINKMKHEGDLLELKPNVLQVVR